MRFKTRMDYISSACRGMGSVIIRPHDAQQTEEWAKTRGSQPDAWRTSRCGRGRVPLARRNRTGSIVRLRDDEMKRVQSLLVSRGLRLLQARELYAQS